MKNKKYLYFCLSALFLCCAVPQHLCGAHPDYVALYKKKKRGGAHHVGLVGINKPGKKHKRDGDCLLNRICACVENHFKKLRTCAYFSEKYSFHVVTKESLRFDSTKALYELRYWLEAIRTGRSKEIPRETLLSSKSIAFYKNIFTTTMAQFKRVLGESLCKEVEEEAFNWERMCQMASKRPEELVTEGMSESMCRFVGAKNAMGSTMHDICELLFEKTDRDPLTKIFSDLTGFCQLLDLLGERFGDKTGLLPAIWMHIAEHKKSCRDDDESLSLIILLDRVLSSSLLHAELITQIADLTTKKKRSNLFVVFCYGDGGLDRDLGYIDFDLLGKILARLGYKEKYKNDQRRRCMQFIEKRIKKQNGTFGMCYEYWRFTNTKVKKIEFDDVKSVISKLSQYCDACDKYAENLKLCARCRLARYCDRKCQMADWKNHKKVCCDYKKEIVSQRKKRFVYKACGERFPDFDTAKMHRIKKQGHDVVEIVKRNHK